jgi:Na+-transporting methylmalonyl-CoA/oxaloacetate decarboxylase beta subunit
MKKLKILTSFLTVISGIYLFAVHILPKILLKVTFGKEFSENIKTAKSFGIIGGADGPTQIYLSHLSKNKLSVLSAVFFASLAVNIYARIKTCKKNNQKNT